jgi:hypothetical protein
MHVKEFTEVLTNLEPHRHNKTLNFPFNLDQNQVAVMPSLLVESIKQTTQFNSTGTIPDMLNEPSTPMP